jgi:hypothetical protein
MMVAPSLDAIVNTKLIQKLSKEVESDGTASGDHDIGVSVPPSLMRIFPKTSSTNRERQARFGIPV